MLEMKVDRMRMHVTARFKVEGSVLSDTVQADMVGVKTQLELESPEPPEKDRATRAERRAGLLRDAGAHEGNTNGIRRRAPCPWPPAP